MKPAKTTIPAAALAAALAMAVAASPSSGFAPAYHDNDRRGKLVRIGKRIPHAAGAMADRRILNNLRYLARRYDIHVVEGYAGPLRGFGQVGCRACHVSRSDHYNGLAVDIVPRRWDGAGCDRSWKPVNRLARWAEPRQNRPRLPFRWVGYNRDFNHGCGDHLHLSWNHAPARRFRVADWVTVFKLPLEPYVPESDPEPLPPTPVPPLPPPEARE